MSQSGRKGKVKNRDDMGALESADEINE